MGLTCAASLHAAHEPEAVGVEIITGPNQIARLDRDTLRAIYLMRLRKWPDGTPVRVFVLPEQSATHDRFSREILGTFPYILQRVWDRLVFTGTGLAPEVVNSEAEMERRVRDTAGAIGYRSTQQRSENQQSLAASNRPEADKNGRL